MVQPIRKQIVFKSKDRLEAIEKAVEKINKDSRDGESISVNRFIAQKAYEAALQVLKRGK